MNEDELERQLRDAVAAETEPVRVDEAASLTSIRQRVASARRRRLVGATALGAAAALVVGVAIGAAVGGDDDHTNVATGGPRTTIGGDCASTTTGPVTTYGPTSAPSMTIVVHDGTSLVVPPETPPPPPGPDDDTVAAHSGDGCDEESTTTTVPPSATATSTAPTTTVPPSTTTAVAPDGRVVYPFAGVGVAGEGNDTPEATATAFLHAIGAENVALGDFQDQGSFAGTFQVHPTDSNGTTRTDIVRSTLAGWASAFEAVLHVQVIGQGGADFRRNTTAMANGGAAPGDPQLQSFTANVDVSGSSGQVATIVISNEDKDGAPADLVAVTFKLP
jgi:hypothetical protein